VGAFFGSLPYIMELTVPELLLHAEQAHRIAERRRDG
jgi:hypothetical protein